MSDLKMSCPSCGAWTNSVGQAALDGEPCPYCGRPLPARPSPVTDAVPLVERLTEAVRLHGAFESDPGGWRCYCDEVVHDTETHVARALLPVVEQAVAEARGEALREAAEFIADTAGIGESANDFGRGWYGALDYAVGELRNRADAIATTEGAP